MPRKKVKVAEYTTSGKLIQHYQSMQEVRDKYYEGKKIPLWGIHADIHFLENGNVLTRGWKGEAWLLPELRKLQDPFKIHKKMGEGMVRIYNVNGEWLGTFVNASIAHKITKVPVETIYYQLNNKGRDDAYAVRTGIRFESVKHTDLET